MLNEKTKLLNKASTKKMPETVLTMLVVLGNSKFMPSVNSKAVAVNKKQPKLNGNLFSPL